MRYFEVEGPSAAEALQTFLMEHDIPRDYVKYEVLENGSKGFLGFGKKSARIKIVFDDKEYLLRKGKLILSELLDRAGFHEYRLEVKERHPDYVLNIQSMDSNLLIGKTAQTLDAFQFMLEKMLGVDEKSDIRILVDVEDYRERVIEQLKDKAVKLAKVVLRTGKTAKLPPMVTMVRKEIHMVLKDIKGISSISSGDGLVKQIFIVPERKKKAAGAEGTEAEGTEKRTERSEKSDSRSDNRRGRGRGRGRGQGQGQAQAQGGEKQERRERPAGQTRDKKEAAETPAGERAPRKREDGERSRDNRNRNRNRRPGPRKEAKGTE